MRPLQEFTHAAAIATVFTDIDDTLTRHGRLSATAYTALENLHDAGLRVVPITGRPAACLGTRIVGAANLSIGIHTATADSTPMFVLVGQVGQAAHHRGLGQGHSEFYPRQ